MKTYIDEAGQTGSDIMSTDQPIFVMAGVMLNTEQERVILKTLDEQFNSCKEATETEIKGSSWSKSAKKSIALQTIIEEILRQNGDISIIIFEKRFMAGAMIVDNFFDYVYNDIEDYKWVNNRDAKIEGANYFAERMSDQLGTKVWDLFRTPQPPEAFGPVIEELLHITDNAEYRSLLEGAKPHIKELVDDLYGTHTVSTPLDSISNSTKRAPNFSGFNRLVEMLVPHCLMNGQTTELIVDNQYQFEPAYRCLFDLFRGIQKPVIPLGPKPDQCLYSWNGVVTGLTHADSKVEKGLQLADIVASSVNSMMLKTQRGDMSKFLELDLFNMALLHSLDSACHTVHYVVSKPFFIKYMDAVQDFSTRIDKVCAKSSYIRAKMK